jgi:hypothetical protein
MCVLPQKDPAEAAAENKSVRLLVVSMVEEAHLLLF